MKKTFLLLWTAFLIGLAGCVQPEVQNLQLEMKENPLGIQLQQPRFSWQLHSDKPNLQQTAYRIQVAETPEQLTDGKELLWDSGTVTSDQSHLVSYGGKALEPGSTCYWRVKLETNQGNTPWSPIGYWSMAPDATTWEATRWIGENALSNPGENAGTEQNSHTRLAARYLRKEFNIDRAIQRAYLYISGVGSYEAYLNGQRVSEDIFAPMPSVYTDRVYYNVYDVTNLLGKATNTLGVVLGNGRFFTMRNPGMIHYGLPRMTAQLQIEYADHSTQTVISNDSWKVTSQGPIIANNEFDGEIYDARLEMGGWNQNGFDDSGWKQADLMEAPGGQLVAQQNPNIRAQETIRPIAITERPDGKYILDMGQNMVGWLAVELNGKKDQPITMKFAELLQEDGSLYLANLRTAEVTDSYTPAKDAPFRWEPSFVYHGFRFVEISGLDYKPELTAFEGKVIYDQMATTGKMETSHPLVNQIHKNAYWGIRGNYRGMPTDCPQRDERLGWLGDRATGAYGEAFLFNNAQLYTKWLQDIEDSMSPEGAISDVSPYYWTLHNDDVTWPSAFFYIADMLYRQYGDDQAIRTHYPAMKRWLKHIQETAMKDDIVIKDTYGDWCMPPERQELIHSEDPARKTDGAILSTTVYYDLLNKMAHFARLCGQEADIPAYEALAARIKTAYNEKFFHPETAQYGNNTVTANMLSLRLGLVPEGYEQKVFDNIIRKTEEDFDGHVSTGVLGIQHLMRGLTEYGREDLAFRITTNETYPSWGYMIHKGATTIWELWNGDTADPAMNSANHVMLLGDLLIWYYEDLAGIQCAPDAVGFKKLLMAPVFPDGLDAVDASYQSVYGEIRSHWTRTNGTLRWEITLPGNTSATVRIPKHFGITASRQPGIKQTTDQGDYIEFEITSGHYLFGE